MSEGVASKGDYIDNPPVFSQGLAHVAFIRGDGKNANNPRWANAGIGFIDKKGNTVIDPICQDVKPFSEGLAACMDKTGSWGFLDKRGAWAVTPAYLGSLSFREGLAAVSMADGRPRFIDKKGKIVIELPFKGWVRSFSEGRAYFESTGKRGFIDNSGRIVIETDGYSRPGDFHEGLAVLATSDGGTIFIDKNGKNSLGRRFHDAKAFSEGLAAVRFDKMDEKTPAEWNGRWGFITPKGEAAIEPLSLEGFNLREDGFSEGWIQISYREKHESSLHPGRKDYRDVLGYMNVKGEVKIKLGDAQRSFFAVAPFSQGLAAVDIQNPGNVRSKGYINTQGELVIERKPFSKLVRTGGIGDRVFSFSEGLACVISDYRAGFIDKSGKLVIEQRFGFPFRTDTSRPPDGAF